MAQASSLWLSGRHPCLPLLQHFFFDGASALEKFDAGAALVQLYTGFIYEGPGLVKKICRALVGR